MQVNGMGWLYGYNTLITKECPCGTPIHKYPIFSDIQIRLNYCSDYCEDRYSRMSMANRQKTCAVCGREFKGSDQVKVQPLVDDRVRYVAVHQGESIICTQAACKERGDL